MQIKGCFLLFTAGLLLSQAAYSQVVSDSSQYRQVKLGIWCETTRFIYADNGADSLLQRLNCRNWETLRASLELNALGEKPFFEAIEKPAIYAGYTSYDAKLGKLIEEIGKKLKSSPSRRSSEPRLQGVDSLQRKLAAIAANPQAYVATGGQQQAQNQPVYEEPQNKNPQESIQAQAAGLEEEPGEEGFAWLEIAQWALMLLLAVATALLYKKNSRLEEELKLRMARRKQEIANLAVKKDKEPVLAVEPAPIPAAAGMEEKEVLRLIRKELDRFRQQQQMKTARGAAAARVPQPATPPKKEVSEKNEVLASPMESKEQAFAETGIYYDKLPFKGGFHQNHLSRQPHADSIYTIQVLRERPEEAAFWVTEDQDVQKYAMQNGLSFFEEACDYSQLEESPSRVRNLEKGVLRKRGHLWQIEKKAKVSFE